MEPLFCAERLAYPLWSWTVSHRKTRRKSIVSWERGISDVTLEAHYFPHPTFLFCQAVTTASSRQKIYKWEQAPTHLKSEFSWKVKKIAENQENLVISRISFHFFWFSKNFLKKQKSLPIGGCGIFKENIYHFSSLKKIELNREEHEKDRAVWSGRKKFTSTNCKQLSNSRKHSNLISSMFPS